MCRMPIMENIQSKVAVCNPNYNAIDTAIEMQAV